MAKQQRLSPEELVDKLQQQFQGDGPNAIMAFLNEVIGKLRALQSNERTEPFAAVDGRDGKDLPPPPQESLEELLGPPADIPAPTPIIASEDAADPLSPADPVLAPPGAGFQSPVLGMEIPELLAQGRVDDLGGSTATGTPLPSFPAAEGLDVPQIEPLAAAAPPTPPSVEPAVEIAALEIPALAPEGSGFEAGVSTAFELERVPDLPSFEDIGPPRAAPEPVIELEIDDIPDLELHQPAVRPLPPDLDAPDFFQTAEIPPPEDVSDEHVGMYQEIEQERSSGMDAIIDILAWNREIQRIHNSRLYRVHAQAMADRSHYG